MLESAAAETGFGAHGRPLLRRPADARTGIELVTRRRRSTRFEGDGERVQRVVCELGPRLEADMVVMGTGAVPDVMLARARGARARGDAAASAAARRWRRPRRACGRRATCASTTRCCTAGGCGSSTGRSRSPRASTSRAAMLGTRRPFDEVPYFWSDLADWCSARVRRPGGALGPRGRARLDPTTASSRSSTCTAAAWRRRSPSAARTTSSHARRWLAERTELGGSGGLARATRGADLRRALSAAVGRRGRG